MKRLRLLAVVGSLLGSLLALGAAALLWRYVRIHSTPERLPDIGPVEWPEPIYPDFAALEGRRW